MNLYFDKNYAGKIYTGSGALYDYTPEIDAFNGVSASVDDSAVKQNVILTGYWTRSTRGNYMYQLTTGEWINMYADGWTLKGTVNYPQATAQDYVNRMIENNKQIVSCNLFCARYASKLTASEKQQLYNLQTRLELRNQRLINDGLCTELTTSTPAGYSQLQSYLQSFMQTGGVGLVISTTAVIVITAIVIASMSTAAYFAYKYLYEQSADDVRYSKQLTETLMAKLTPEEYQQLLKETQGIVTKSKIKTMIAGSGSLLKWALLGTAAYFLYDKWKGGKQ